MSADRSIGRPTAGRGASVAARRWAHRAAAPAVSLPFAALVAVVSVVLHVQNAAGVEQPPPFGWFHFADFRDTVWLPTRDLLAGHDPYDLTAYLDRNPGAQEFPLYAPAVLLVGIVFAPLPLWAAMAVWAFVLVGSVVVIVRSGLRIAGAPVGVGPVALVAALLVLTPPGRQALSSGQFAVPAAAACLVAMSSDRRWVGALAVAVALVKPQVGIPLLGVLLVLGRWRAARDGSLVAIAASLPVAAILVVRSGGVLPWIRTLTDNLDLSFSSPATSASRSGSTRIDIAGLLSRLGVDLTTTGTAVLTLVVLAISLAVLRVVVRRDGGAGLPVVCAATGALVLAAPTELYAYLVALPAVLLGLAALTGAGGGRTAAPGILLLVPFLNVTTVVRAIGLPELTVLNTVAIVLGSVVLPLLLGPGRVTAGAQLASGSRGTPPRGAPAD